MNWIWILIGILGILGGAILAIVFSSRASKNRIYKRLYEQKVKENIKKETSVEENKEIETALKETIKKYKEYEEQLNKQIAEKIEILREKEEMIAAKQAKIEEINGFVEEKQKNLVSFEEEKGKIKEEIEILKKEKEKNELERQVIESSLERLKNIERNAVLAVEKDYKDGLWDIDVTDRDNELIKVLERIKMDYPDLKTDIAMIEWKKIWLPKLQDLSNREGLECKGIYRLVLKEDDRICYVGQAVSIKDRWYEHVKKMIGVAAKGTEKLYNYRPEDFYWSVIEKEENGVKIDLNSSEHYWIEFYACKEVGLNKKR